MEFAASTSNRIGHNAWICPCGRIHRTARHYYEVNGERAGGSNGCAGVQRAHVWRPEASSDPNQAVFDFAAA